MNTDIHIVLCFPENNEMSSNRNTVKLLFIFLILYDNKWFTKIQSKSENTECMFSEEIR